MTIGPTMSALWIQMWVDLLEFKASLSIYSEVQVSQGSVMKPYQKEEGKEETSSPSLFL